MSSIPPGYFRTAVTRSGKSSLFFVTPFLIIIWVVVMFLPWEAWFEENGAVPLFFHALKKLMNFGEAPFPWVSLLFTVIMFLFVLMMVHDGLKSLFSPEKSMAVLDLEKLGDPFEMIADFEKEAASHVALRWEKPMLVATDNWLLMQNTSDVILLTISKLAWVYDKSDSTADFTNFAFRRAGMLTRSQAAQAKASDERTLIFWVEGNENKFSINVPPDFDDLVEHLLRRTQHMIFGYHKDLQKYWDTDRAKFKEAAIAFIAAGGGASGSDFSFFDTIFDLAEGGSDVAEGLGEL